MPPKYSKRRLYRKYGKTVAKAGMPVAKTLNYSAKILQSAARRAVTQQLNKKAETKTACYSTTDGGQIYHNNFISMTPNILATTQGTNDAITSNQNCRIGDQINLRGVSLKMMVELNERYSDVTLRLLIVRAAKGDTPTRATLYNGLSGNKMLDTINTERYTIIFQKYIKLKSPNPSVSNLLGASTEVSDGITNAGIEASNRTDTLLSRATKIVKVWIPGTKMVKNGIVKYEDNSSQCKFFDYHVLLYAYSNYTTAQDQWYIARLNDYVQQVYFKDL